MMNVKLSSLECQIATHVGKTRNDNAKSRSAENLKKSDRSDSEIHIRGAAGELAVAKALNVYPDLAKRLRGQADIIYKGYAADVKTTRYQTGSLLAHPKKVDREAVDFFVLVVGEMPDFRLAGWAAYDELIADEAYRETFGGYDKPAYVLSQEELRDISDLLD